MYKINAKYQAAACPASAKGSAAPGPAWARPVAWAGPAAAWYSLFILYPVRCAHTPPYCLVFHLHCDGHVFQLVSTPVVKKY